MISPGDTHILAVPALEKKSHNFLETHQDDKTYAVPVVSFFKFSQLLLSFKMFL